MPESHSAKVLQMCFSAPLRLATDGQASSFAWLQTTLSKLRPDKTEGQAKQIVNMCFLLAANIPIMQKVISSLDGACKSQKNQKSW
jgi:hypothetical protein